MDKIFEVRNELEERLANRLKYNISTDTLKKDVTNLIDWLFTFLEKLERR
jgi:hypothetical protein